MYNKSEVINKMAEKITGTKVDAEKYLNAFLEVVEDSVKDGEGIKIVGSFNVEIKETAERKGRNPSTKEEIIIPAGKTVKIKASKILKDLVK